MQPSLPFSSRTLSADAFILGHSGLSLACELPEGWEWVLCTFAYPRGLREILNGILFCVLSSTAWFCRISPLLLWVKLASLSAPPSPWPRGCFLRLGSVPDDTPCWMCLFLPWGLASHRFSGIRFVVLNLLEFANSFDTKHFFFFKTHVKTTPE